MKKENTEKSVTPDDGLASLFRLRKLHDLEHDTAALIHATASLGSQLNARCQQRGEIQKRIEKLKEQLAQLHPSDEQNDHLQRLGELHGKLNTELDCCPSDGAPEKKA